MLPLRRINPAISMRTERAILWAIELHPDLRPDAIETLRQYLFGTKELPNRPLHTRPQRRPALEALLAPPENLLLAAGVALLFIGLIATLGH